MARSQETFTKREREKQRIKKQQEKQEKMAERKAQKKDSSLEDMMAYIDENGNITSTPPNPSRKKTFNAEDIEIGVPQKKEPEPGELERRGVVTYYNNSKGFGFIKDSENGESIFFHQNDVAWAVVEGNMMVFEIEPGPKGPVAVNIRKG